jgi:NADH dehydrogenase
LCGEKVMSMKELFLSVFMTFGKSPYLFEMPKQFFLLAYPLLSLFDIISKDEVLMIEDNICKDKNG